MKRFVSAVAPLRPVQIVDVATGEILDLNTLDTLVEHLVDFVVSESQWLYFERGDVLEQEIIEAKRIGSPNSFARQRGFRSNAHLLPRAVKAKSRINELVLHKLVSEVSSYVLNPNPRKQKPSFSRKVHLGAVDKQMASLSLDDNVLTLRFKVWDRDLLLDFQLPEYILHRSIVKWSLPTIEYRHDKPYFLFSVQEQPKVRQITHNKAGIDLGRKEPFTLAVVNQNGARIADYTANGVVRTLNAKRERLLQEKKLIVKKAVQYEQLGLDSTILRKEARYVARKALILGDEVARQVGADVARKLAKHDINEVAIEDLRWVHGAKYGGRWNHSKKQAAIQHATQREGIKTTKVNPKNTSQQCHFCHARVIHNAKNRVAKCTECQEQFDRDFNAAMNIAKKLTRSPNRYSRIGEDRSTPEQVIEDTPQNSTLRSIAKIQLNVLLSDTMHPFEQHVFIAHIIYDLRRGADDTIGHAALATPAQDMFYRRMLQSISTLGISKRTTWEQVALDIAVSDYRATCGDDAPSWYDTMLELLISFYGNTYEMEHQLPRTAYSRMGVQITIRAAVAWLAKNHVLHNVLDGAYALHQRLYPGQSVTTDQGYRIIFRAMVLSCLDHAVQSVVKTSLPFSWQEPLVAVRMAERISSPNVLDSMEQTVRDYFGLDVVV